MRTCALLLLVAACADTTANGVDYTRIAEEVGGTIATPDAGGETGALADALSIARGQMPTGFARQPGALNVVGYHDGLRYTYNVQCEDAHRVRMECSPVTFRATAIIEWQHRIAIWTLDHLQGPAASVTGASSLASAEAFLVDRESARPRHGRIALALSEGVTGSVSFDGSRTARIELDDQVFALDLASGAITPAGSP